MTGISVIPSTASRKTVQPLAREASLRSVIPVKTHRDDELFQKKSPFPIGPGHEVAERWPAVMAPRQRRVLHLAQRTNARGAPACQLIDQLARLVLDRRQTNRRDPSADRVGALQR